MRGPAVVAAAAVLALTAAAAVAQGETTFLGVRCPEGPGDGAPGVPINAIIAGSAAERIGLAPGDRVLAIDGRPVADYDGLLGRVVERSIGHAVVLEVRRGDSVEWTVPVLGPKERPGFEPIPAAEPLLEAVEGLAAGAGRAFAAGDRAGCRGRSLGLEAALRRHLAAARMALEEVAGRQLEDRAEAARAAAAWFAARVDDGVPVLEGAADGEDGPSPVELEVVGPGRFAVRMGVLTRSEREVEVLVRRAEGPVGRRLIGLFGRDGFRAAGVGEALRAGDRLEWVE